jgi:hypothetical protein
MLLPGKETVDDYIDEFLELIHEAGYIDGLSIIMKFRRGLDRDIQDQIAEMVQRRLKENDPEGWYNAAHMLNANRTANQAFHGVHCAVATAPNVHLTFLTLQTAILTQPVAPAPTVHAPQYPGVPTWASNPVPMDIDATCHRNAIPMLCRHCGEPERFARRCLCYMTLDEKQDLLERLIAVAEVQSPTPDIPVGV